MQILQRMVSQSDHAVLPVQGCGESSGLRPLPPASYSFSRLHLGRLCTSISAPWETILATREHPGGPWRQQDGREGIRNWISIYDGWVLKPFLEIFLGTEA